MFFFITNCHECMNLVSRYAKYLKLINIQIIFIIYGRDCFGTFLESTRIVNKNDWIFMGIFLEHL